MTLKMKLISMISAFMLVLGLMLIGIYAVNQISVDFGGNISFTATDVYARVTGQISNAGVGSQTLPTLNFDAGMTDEEVETEQARWSGLNLAFDEDATPITIEVTVENLSISHTLRVNLTDNTTSNENLEIAYQQDGEEYINGDDITLPKSTGDGTSKTTYLITFSIPNPNFSLPSTDFSIDINLYDESYVPPAAAEVTSVQINDSTPTTTNEYNGGKDFDEVIDLSNIQFETGETEVVISMTSLNANYIKNIVSYDSGAVDYNAIGTSGTLFVHSTSLYLPQNTGGELTSGESKDLTIYVNNNTGSPTTISGLQVSFEEKTSLIQADTENEYWYVEMGTVMGETESEYIRWKYIASVDDSSGSDVATKYATFDANTAPIGEGYFYLETNVLTAIGRDGTNNMIEVSFNNEYIYNSSHSPTDYHQQHGWTNVQTNDYATSNVRQYINGNDSYDSYSGNSSSGYIPSGRLSNMYDDLNIDTANDIIYNQIITRSLGELYQDNTNSKTNPSDVPFPDLSGADAGYQYQETDEDAFWLLSYYEVYQLTGGSSTTDRDSGRVWPTGSPDRYWLRSPYSSYSYIACDVSTSGNLSINGVDVNTNAARAAFKFSVDNIA